MVHLHKLHSNFHENCKVVKKDCEKLHRIELCKMRELRLLIHG